MTELRIVARRNGKTYALDVAFDAVWLPLDVGVDPISDMLPTKFEILTIKTSGGASIYNFPMRED
jgi:hypothetical protein